MNKVLIEYKELNSKKHIILFQNSEYIYVLETRHLTKEKIFTSVAYSVYADAEYDAKALILNCL